jgi:superoxide dismutase, Fe-Mn family
MKYEPKSFEHLLGTKGFSDQLLKNHFTLYQGYVTNTNKLTDLLGQIAQDGKTGTPEYAEVKRRFGWEFNGMRLHELYFGNMTKDAAAPDANSAFIKKVGSDFGGYSQWEKEFKATGALRGIGWVVLSYDPIGARLFNLWINEHDVGHLAGTAPLLIMDVFEHAFITDYGLKRADYIEAFYKAVDWKTISQRFDGAVKKTG